MTEVVLRCVVISAAALSVAILLAGFFAQDTQTAGVLFGSVRIFSSTSEHLSPSSNVLVVGNAIQRISTARMIAAHTHRMMADTPLGTPCSFKGGQQL